eukprot:GHVQ01024720.1.p1 GENE.GHVQ01024720.1~~GHVQ01024720.1.p1  ORF type:complete len:1390 (-),score=201.67 GHVQ01024720.1:39-4208(-)
MNNLCPSFSSSCHSSSSISSTNTFTFDSVSQQLFNLWRDPSSAASVSDWLLSFQHSPEAWSISKSFLDASQHLQIVGAQTLSWKVRYEGSKLSCDDHKGIVSFIFQKLKQTLLPPPSAPLPGSSCSSSTDASHPQSLYPRGVVDRLAECMSVCVSLSMSRGWQSAIEDIVNSVCSDDIGVYKGYMCWVIAMTLAGIPQALKDTDNPSMGYEGTSRSTKICESSLGSVVKFVSQCLDACSCPQIWDSTGGEACGQQSVDLGKGGSSLVGLTSSACNVKWYDKGVRMDLMDASLKVLSEWTKHCGVSLIRDSECGQAVSRVVEGFGSRLVVCESVMVCITHSSGCKELWNKLDDRRDDTQKDLLLRESQVVGQGGESIFFHSIFIQLQQLYGELCDILNIRMSEPVNRENDGRREGRLLSIEKVTAEGVDGVVPTLIMWCDIVTCLTDGFPQALFSSTSYRFIQELIKVLWRIHPKVAMCLYGLWDQLKEMNREGMLTDRLLTDLLGNLGGCLLECSITQCRRDAGWWGLDYTGKTRTTAGGNQTDHFVGQGGGGDEDEWKEYVSSTTDVVCHVYLLADTVQLGVAFFNGLICAMQAAVTQVDAVGCEVVVCLCDGILEALNTLPMFCFGLLKLVAQIPSSNDICVIPAAVLVKKISLYFDGAIDSDEIVLACRGMEADKTNLGVKGLEAEGSSASRNKIEIETYLAERKIVWSCLLRCLISWTSCAPLQASEAIYEMCVWGGHNVSAQEDLQGFLEFVQSVSPNQSVTVDSALHAAFMQLLVYLPSEDCIQAISHSMSTTVAEMVAVVTAVDRQVGGTQVDDMERRKRKMFRLLHRLRRCFGSIAKPASGWAAGQVVSIRAKKGSVKFLLKTLRDLRQDGTGSDVSNVCESDTGNRSVLEWLVCAALEVFNKMCNPVDCRRGGLEKIPRISSKADGTVGGQARFVMESNNSVVTPVDLSDLGLLSVMIGTLRTFIYVIKAPMDESEQTPMGPIGGGSPGHPVPSSAYPKEQRLEDQQRLDLDRLMINLVMEVLRCPTQIPAQIGQLNSFREGPEHSESGCVGMAARGWICLVLVDMLKFSTADHGPVRGNMTIRLVQACIQNMECFFDVMAIKLMGRLKKDAYGLLKPFVSLLTHVVQARNVLERSSWHNATDTGVSVAASGGTDMNRSSMEFPASLDFLATRFYLMSLQMCAELLTCHDVMLAKSVLMFLHACVSAKRPHDGLATIRHQLPLLMRRVFENMKVWGTAAMSELWKLIAKLVDVLGDEIVVSACRECANNVVSVTSNNSSFQLPSTVPVAVEEAGCRKGVGIFQRLNDREVEIVLEGFRRLKGPRIRSLLTDMCNMENGLLQSDFLVSYEIQFTNNSSEAGTGTLARCIQGRQGTVINCDS